ncbi:MAG: hypothetical protein AB1486_31815 [Planctomycetota bacterium]
MTLRYLHDLFLSERYGYLGLALAGSVALGWRRLRRREVCVPLFYTVLLAGVLPIPYLVLPEQDWQQVYLWSAGRLISQIIPMGFLAVSSLVLPRPLSTR